jgi:AraC-like DNA-binding protein
MPSARRVTGAWAQLLSDWLDRETLAAPDVRAALARFAPDDVVPVPVWVDLLARAVALRPDRLTPGLEIGSGVQAHHVGVLGYLVLASATLADAMLAYQRYERLFYGVDIAEVEPIDTAAGPMVEIRWENAGLSPIADELAIAALVTFLRRQMEKPSPPARVAFMHRAGVEAAAEYERFFGCPVDFGDTHVRVRFPAGYLALPMPRSDPALRVMLDRQAQALLAALPESAGFDRALQQLLLRLLPEGEATLERLARELHQSPRTLQRRLADGGLSWQQLLDRTREQLAHQYLADRSLSMSDIALLLGYTEQSALTRAVKRWTGRSPRQLRG